MSEVKRYYVGNNSKALGGIGLVEMSLQYAEETGFRGLVAGEDFDRLTAERDALQLRLTTADQRVDDLVAAVRANHEWHKLYDEHDGYSGSAIYQTNIEAMNPAVDAELPDVHICPGCGNKGWSANCDQCIPY